LNHLLSGNGLAPEALGEKRRSRSSIYTYHSTIIIIRLASNTTDHVFPLFFNTPGT